MFLISCFFSAFLMAAQAFTAENETKKMRKQRLQQSPNFKDGKFRNLIETPMLAPDASYWKIMMERLKSNAQTTPKKPLPSIKSDLKAESNPAKVQLTWLGHSTLFLQMNGKNILIDPVLSNRTSPFQFMGPKNFAGTNIYKSEDFPELDILLISHDHFDHLDKKTVVDLAQKVKHFYVPLGVGKLLTDWKIPTQKITELDWWDEIQITEDLLLAATPARHFSGRGLTNRNETLWTSYVVKSQTHTIYLGADSGYGPHFKQIGQKYGPFDLTTLECGQYNAAWPNIHMMPEETAQAHLDLNGKVLLPIHWSKFSLALHSWTEPIDRLLKETNKHNIPVATPLIGEQLILGNPVVENHWWQELQ